MWSNTFKLVSWYISVPDKKVWQLHLYAKTFSASSRLVEMPPIPCLLKSFPSWWRRHSKTSEKNVSILEISTKEETIEKIKKNSSIVCSKCLIKNPNKRYLNVSSLQLMKFQQQQSNGSSSFWIYLRGGKIKILIVPIGFEGEHGDKLYRRV